MNSRKAAGVILLLIGIFLTTSLLFPRASSHVEVGDAPTAEETVEEPPKPLTVELVGYTATPDGWVGLSGSVKGGVRPRTIEVDWGDGSVDREVDGIPNLHQYESPGIYEVTLTAIDANGDTASDTLTVRSHVAYSGSIVDAVVGWMPTWLRLGLGVLMIGLGVSYLREARA